MKKTLTVFLLLIFLPTAVISMPAVSDARSTTVRGYHKKNGTYVKPHRRTKANNSKMDNWSTKGNKNPYTGKKGSVNPYKPKKSKRR